MSVPVRSIPVIASGVRVTRKLMTTAPTSCAPPLPDPQAPIGTGPLLVSFTLALASVSAVAAVYGAKLGVYLVCGLLLGIALYHARFGFAVGWQRLTTVGNGTSARAHLLLLGTAASVVMLIASTGSGLFGSRPTATAGTLGIALVLGATLFGVGMQLAGSCASGTLFAVGGGQAIVGLTLGGFIAGAVFYTWSYPVLGHLPRASGILLSDHFGWFGSWAVTVAVLLGLAATTLVVQRRRVPPPVAPVPTARGLARIYRGSWPPLVGAVVLGVLAGVVFLVSGKVWGVSAAFALWGAKLLQVVGVHPETWEFWQQTTRMSALGSPLLTDRTTLTNFGIMIGAAAAAAAAGAWQARSSVPRRMALGLLVGGFLMGLGSGLAEGCNIGGLLGGISVGSLHGWVWGFCALTGTWLGVSLRPVFGLTSPKSEDGMC
jgi:uncharacterized protein